MAALPWPGLCLLLSLTSLLILHRLHPHPPCWSPSLCHSHSPSTRSPSPATLCSSSPAGSLVLAGLAGSDLSPCDAGTATVFSPCTLSLIAAQSVDAEFVLKTVSPSSSVPWEFGKGRCRWKHPVSARAPGPLKPLFPDHPKPCPETLPKATPSGLVTLQIC